MTAIMESWDIVKMIHHIISLSKDIYSIRIT